MEQAKAHVIDNNHGIEHRRSIFRLNKQGTASAMVYVPWYYGTLAEAALYYTRGDKRVECSTWEQAYDYIARSRRMPTSKDVRSTYAQEAKSAGISVDQKTSPATAELTIDPWYHPRYNDMAEYDYYGG